MPFESIETPSTGPNWPLHVAIWMLGSLALGGATLGVWFAIWTKAEPYWRWRGIILAWLAKVRR